MQISPSTISPSMISRSMISPFMCNRLPDYDRHQSPFHETRQPINWFSLWLILVSSGLLTGTGAMAHAESMPAFASPLAASHADCRHLAQDACDIDASCVKFQRNTCATDAKRLVAIAEPEVLSLPPFLLPPFSLPPYSVTSLPPQPSEMAPPIADWSATTSTHSLSPIPQLSIPQPASTTTLSSLPLLPAAPPIAPDTVAIAPPDGREIDLKPDVIENSPLLQRWLREIPDITSEITNSPSFRTRLRLGYSQFPSTDQSSGINVGLEDVFLGRSGLTVSGDYYRTLNGQRQGWGADLHYYVRPLGSYINVSPVVGYRRLDTPLYSTDGLNLGMRLVVVLSRGGGADFSLTQTWLAPSSDREIGILNFSAGYALTPTLRLSADVEQQNARQRQDSRATIVLEWLL